MSFSCLTTTILSEPGSNAVDKLFNLIAMRFWRKTSLEEVVIARFCTGNLGKTVAIPPFDRAPAFVLCDLLKLIEPVLICLLDRDPGDLVHYKHVEPETERNTVGGQGGGCLDRPNAVAQKNTLSEQEMFLGRRNVSEKQADRVMAGPHALKAWDLVVPHPSGHSM